MKFNFIQKGDMRKLRKPNKIPPTLPTPTPTPPLGPLQIILADDTAEQLI